MTAFFGGVCHIPALTFLARLRRSRFADGKLEATSNILLMESTSVFVRLKAVAVALLILLCYCGLNSNAACAATSYYISYLLQFFSGREFILKAESCLLQLTLFICDVEYIGALSHSIKYLLLICRGLSRFYFG